LGVIKNVKLETDQISNFSLFTFYFSLSSLLYPEPTQMKNSHPHKTLYWNDYETFGKDPRRDRPAQFAGIRTDEDLNIIGDPLKIYCKPADDMLPDPEACLITGITPQKAMKQGVPEAEFIGRIHSEFSQSETCGVGYNSIRFDDEITRFALYRNFFDPYEREWKNGNSRWDIIDMARLMCALRPEGMNWPRHPDGKPSFRLGDLTAANGISHTSAHDALSDVYATIDLARLIRKHQPNLYKYVYENRDKHSVSRQLSIFAKKPVLHVSRMYPAETGCIAMVVPIAPDPSNSNGIIVYDLSADPEPLLTLSPEEIRERVFTRADDLPEGIGRIPLKAIHINKCPVIVTHRTLERGHSELVKIDVSACLSHLEAIKKAGDLNAKMWKVFSKKDLKTEAEAETDPDDSLYSGGFFSSGDKKKMEKIRSCPSEALGGLRILFRDPRVPEMLFRYRARNYPETLSPEEKARWDIWRMGRLTSSASDGRGGIVLDEYWAKINEQREKPDNTEEQLALLDALESYGKEISGKNSDL